MIRIISTHIIDKTKRLIQDVRHFFGLECSLNDWFLPLPLLTNSTSCFCLFNTVCVNIRGQPLVWVLIFHLVWSRALYWSLLCVLAYGLWVCRVLSFFHFIMSSGSHACALTQSFCVVSKNCNTGPQTCTSILSIKLPLRLMFKFHKIS